MERRSRSGQTASSSRQTTCATFPVIGIVTIGDQEIPGFSQAEIDPGRTTPAPWASKAVSCGISHWKFQIRNLEFEI
jgi:hypothetical protein